MKILSLLCWLVLIILPIAHAQDDLCAIPLDYANGQAHSKRSDEFTKLLLASASLTRPSPVPSQDEKAEIEWIDQAVSFLDININPERPVFILVIDDFSLRPTRTDPPHGLYVEALVHQLVQHVQPAPLIIYPVNIGVGATRSDVINSITFTLNSLDQVYGSSARYVLNMSFAFIECGFVTNGPGEGGFLQDFELGKVDSLEEGNLDNPDDNRTPEEIGNKFEEASNSSVESMLCDESFVEICGSRLISVAAAGNYGRDEPFAPGIWQDVLSVSANLDNDPSKPYWQDAITGDTISSNKGEVMVPGAWYDLGDLNGNHDPDDVAGSSFAVPVVSVLAGLYLSDPAKSATEFMNLVRGCYQEGNDYGYYYLLHVLQNSCFDR